MLRKIIPHPKRVKEILEALLNEEAWPTHEIPACPEEYALNCKACPKRRRPKGSSSKEDLIALITENIPKNKIPPCVRDVAHEAAKYEWHQKRYIDLADKRKTPANKKKCARKRMKDQAKLNNFLTISKRPKTLQTYGKQSFETNYLDWLIGLRKGVRPKGKNHELARFIITLDRMFTGKCKASVRDGFIVNVIKILEPHRKISEEVISKTRTRYKELRKK